MEMVLKIGRAKQPKMFTRKKFLDGDNKDLLAVLQLAILGASGLILLFQVFLAFRMNAIATRRPTFAQLVNGDAIYISERQRKFRTPEVVRKVVKDWTILTFNWEGIIPGTTEPDKGVGVVGSNRKVPFTMSIASVLMEPEFATATLKQMAEEIVPNDVFSGAVRQVTTIHYVSEPRQLAEGRWQVDVVATRRLISKRTGATIPIAFNKTFTLRAVEIPSSPLGNDASLVERLIYSTMAAGLQITDITPYDSENPPTGGASTPAPPKERPSVRQRQEERQEERNSEKDDDKGDKGKRNRREKKSDQVTPSDLNGSELTPAPSSK
jgi:hypothetical protein